MSKENTISIEIKKADVQAIQKALKTVDDILTPYLQALTIEQRIALPKMSDGTEPFVEKVLAYAESDAQFAPPFLNVPEMKKDFDAVKTLAPIKRMIDQVQSNLEDTLMLAGSESYVASLSYYNSVKLATRMNIPGAKPVYEDLKKRFSKSGKTE